ncbi:MAG: ABC transporter permease [Clostridia bacterium]|nr:ABC transporter permease [Clostridia bacterium]
MKMLTFAKRTLKEILRDPLTLFFGLGFPGVLIVLLSVIQSNIPVPLFEIDKLAPAMIIFGLSFITLFSATIIAKDRESALLTRLYASPMSPLDFIFGYTLPLLPISLVQGVFCFAVGMLFGLECKVTILYATLMVIPLSLFFIALGLLFGSILSQKQVGGVCGALLTNLAAWFSGIWFDLDLVGGTFKKIAYALPFVHGVKIEQALYAGEFEAVAGHLLLVLGYAVVTFALASLLFLRQMRKG